jgi:hypothetical protein
MHNPVWVHDLHPKSLGNEKTKLLSIRNMTGQVHITTAKHDISMKMSAVIRRRLNCDVTGANKNWLSGSSLSFSIIFTVLFRTQQITVNQIANVHAFYKQHKDTRTRVC